MIHEGAEWIANNNILLALGDWPPPQLRMASDPVEAVVHNSVCMYLYTKLNNIHRRAA